MFQVRSPGSFAITERFLKNLQRGTVFNALEAQAQIGVTALSSATPRDTGETANAWSYKVIKNRGSWQIVWTNNHVVDGEPMAILLQYGHGTGTGGYVAGRDFINPAMESVFNKIAENVWREVTKS